LTALSLLERRRSAPWLRMRCRILYSLRKVLVGSLDVSSLGDELRMRRTCRGQLLCRTEGNPGLLTSRIISSRSLCLTPVGSSNPGVAWWTPTGSRRKEGKKEGGGRGQLRPFLWRRLRPLHSRLVPSGEPKLFCDRGTSENGVRNVNPSSCEP